jgi:hypothetical protein
MGVITVDACAGYAYAAGFRGEGLVTIVAGAGPESGYDSTKHNQNSKTQDNSYGLLQINMYDELGPARRKQFALASNDRLFDPATNLHVAYVLSSSGTDFKPWKNTIGKGLHRKYLDAARAACQAVEGRSGAAVASGASPLEASTPGPIAGERVPAGGGLALSPGVRTLYPTISVTGGGGAVEPSARMGISGNVSMSVSSVTEVTLVFADPRGPIKAWTVFLIQTEARFGDLNLVVTRTVWGEQDGVEILTVTLQPSAVVKMRQPDPSGASQQWSNLSPTEVLAERAKAAGLRFYGKGTPRRSSLTRLGVDDAGRDYAESDWEMGQRLAREEGFWFFESAGALYFAPPTWLRSHNTWFPVRRGARGAEYAWETLGIPEAETTIDETPTQLAGSSKGNGSRHLTRTMTFALPRTRGELVRPAMVCQFRGIPGFDGALDNLPEHDGLVVTDVSWALDGGITPATIQVTDAVDPIPEPATDDAALLGADDSAKGPATGTASNFPTGTGVSNQGKGSYGYQYDSPGTVPATGVQPGTQVLMDHLLQKFPISKNIGTWVSRNVQGTTKLSAHAEGRAGDSGVPVSSQYGSGLAAYLVANAGLFGIQLVIWNERSWSAKTHAWKPYTHPDDPNHKDDTLSHRNHVHWELCWEAARYLNAAAIKGAQNG